MSKKKEFSILKWIIFPLNSVLLAGVIAWFNLRVFGWDDGLPYSLIVALIGIFSIIINKYTESENRTLARATFVFEIILTAALICNAAWSLSVQREMSVARMGEQSQKETITEIGKLKGGKTQRKALDRIDKQPSAAGVFARYENTLFWIMVCELGLYGLSAFTLFALAKLMDDAPKIAPVATPDLAQNRPVSDFPAELDVDYRPGRKSAPELSLSRRLTPVATAAAPSDIDRLRAYLKAIAFYHPGRWFKADPLESGDGLWVRFCERRRGREVTIAKVKWNNKVFAELDRVDFQTRLRQRLIDAGFPIGGEQ